MDYVGRYNSPLGTMTMASDGVALVGLWFDGQQRYADVLQADWREESRSIFDETVKWLNVYFSGGTPDVTPRLALRGTEFGKVVWKILATIPYGATTSYGDLSRGVARQLGRAHMSAQAVGGAVARNPISLIIPCHRVVGADGSLTGYAGGLDRKKKLLDWERANTSLSFPLLPNFRGGNVF